MITSDRDGNESIQVPFGESMGYRSLGDSKTAAPLRGPPVFWVTHEELHSWGVPPRVNARMI